MKHVMSERRGKLIEMKKTKRLWAKYRPYLNFKKHVMAEGGSKLIEIKKKTERLQAKYQVRT